MITLITEQQDYSEKAIRLYESLGKVYFLPELSEQEKQAVKQAAHILVVGLQHHINRAWIDEMPHLKVIATNATGLNHIDLACVKERGIKLISLRGQVRFLEKNITSTAELTWGLLLALVRHIPSSFDDVKAGRWDRLRFRGHQLKGKTLGILGYGRYGKMVGQYGRTFRMNVLACDPYVSTGAMKRRGVKKVSLTTLFKTSDVLSLHVLLADDTYNLVKEKHLRLMKPTAYLINTARAELVERGALHKALLKKWIAGAAGDVLWDERSDGSHLNSDPHFGYAKANTNLLIVPHTGGATYEAMEITQEFIADLVVRYFDKRR